MCQLLRKRRIRLNLNSSRSSGFRALMKVLRPLYLKLAKTEEIVSAELFLKEFEKVDVDYRHFNSENYLPGSTGESDLRNDFLNWLGLEPMPRLPGV
jgi:hypothetical protein